MVHLAFIRSTLARLIYAFRFLKRSAGFWSRGLLCLVVGLLVLIGAGKDRYDLRFILRGRQAVAPEIVLVTVNTQEWKELLRQYNYDRNSPNYYDSDSDSFFWHPEIWQKLLASLLNEQPRALGVTLYFGDNLPSSNMRLTGLREFRDRRVLWSSRLDMERRVKKSMFSGPFNSYSGIIEYTTDTDGVVRRFAPYNQKTPTLAVTMARTMHPERWPVRASVKLARQEIGINYRGGEADLFPTLSFTDILENRFPRNYFHGKLVLIGVANDSSRLVRTPVGDLSMVEWVAQVVDNLVSQRTVYTLKTIWCIALLMALIAICTWIMTSYPQTVALVLLIWMSVTLSSISLWVFDNFSFWTPVLAPLIQIAFTYIVFLSFQLTQKENLSWRITQESKYLLEVENLKNNFVSLISHDLKTPLAKIQAICDRLLRNPVPPENWTDSVGSLRKESMELHRYIHSIIQLTRFEAKEVKIRVETADLNEIIFKVYEQVKPLAAEKNIEIEMNLEPLFLLDFDVILIREVILNLVENAIKYSAPGGRIRLYTKETNNLVTFEVEDNGPGVNPADLQHIFQKFYRGMDQVKTKGFGLGLYLVRYFIELHGGQVYVESETGKGAKFGFTLPITESEKLESLEGDHLWKTDSQLSSSKMNWN